MSGVDHTLIGRRTHLCPGPYRGFSPIQTEGFLCVSYRYFLHSHTVAACGAVGVHHWGGLALSGIASWRKCKRESLSSAWNSKAPAPWHSAADLYAAVGCIQGMYINQSNSMFLSPPHHTQVYTTAVHPAAPSNISQPVNRGVGCRNCCTSFALRTSVWLVCGIAAEL